MQILQYCTYLYLLVATVPKGEMSHHHLVMKASGGWNYRGTHTAITHGKPEIQLEWAPLKQPRQPTGVQHQHLGRGTGNNRATGNTFQIWSYLSDDMRQLDIPMMVTDKEYI